MAKIVVLSLCYDNRDLPQIANMGKFRWSNDGWMAHFCDALEDLGHDVIAFPDARYNCMLGHEATNTDFYHLMMGFGPDYLITYKGDYIDYDTFSKIKKSLPNTRFIWWSVDDPYILHYQDEGRALKMSLHSIALTCCVSAMNIYRSMGISPILFYPTIDPKVQNRPEVLGYEISEEDKNKYTCDIVLGGTCYTEKHNSRVAICQAIIEAGLGGGLKLWGHDHWADPTWTEGVDLSPYYQGRVDENDMPKIYHHSKIALNSWVNGGRGNKCGYPTVGYYNWRYFEIMGSGAFQLCEWQESTVNWPYKDGEHLVYWNDHNDLVDKIKYFLKNEDEREEIARNGYELTHSQFTFRKNLEQIFDIYLT